MPAVTTFDRDAGREATRSRRASVPCSHFDAVLPVDLGDGWTLWFVQDGFFDWEADGPASTIGEMQYTNSAVVIFDTDGCAEVIVDGPNANGRFGFEFGPNPDSVVWQRFYWPLGAVAENGVLSVTWAQMNYSDRQPTIYEGISRHHGRTFVATYDLGTLERLSWHRFDDLGVGFGFWATPGTDGWVYHFGNPNLLNLAMNGGLGTVRIPQLGTTSAGGHRSQAGSPRCGTASGGRQISIRRNRCSRRAGREHAPAGAGMSTVAGSRRSRTRSSGVPTCGCWLRTSPRSMAGSESVPDADIARGADRDLRATIVATMSCAATVVVWSNAASGSRPRSNPTSTGRSPSTHRRARPTCASVPDRPSGLYRHVKDAGSLDR